MNIRCMQIWLQKSWLAIEGIVIMPNSLTGLMNANPGIRCMKRMKQDWEKFHPEFSHFLYKIYVVKLVELSKQSYHEKQVSNI